MAAVLNNELGDIKQVTFMMEECKRMHLEVLGPDVNESEYEFSVNEKGQIRFGMGGIRNVGEAAISGIIEERTTNGKFKDLTDFLLRCADKGLNRRALESMDTAGCFDSFPNFHRAMLFYMPVNDSVPFSERALRMVASYNEKKNSAQMDLFGMGGGDSSTETLTLPFPDCERWSKLKELQMELESIGFYISSHPMDSFNLPLRFFSNTTVEAMKTAMTNPEKYDRFNVRLGGQITKAEHLMSKKNTPYGRFTIEDKTGAFSFSLFSENYAKFKGLLDEGMFVLLIGTLSKPFWKQGQEQDAVPKDLEFRISEVRLLDTLLENTSKKVIFKLDVAQMNSEAIDDFIQIVKKHHGKQSYSIQLYDSNMNLSCNMSPFNGGVAAHEVLPIVDQLPYAEVDLK
jgi:DNA polymerase-3 subunit alpha